MGQVSVVCLLYIAGSPRSDADSLPGRIVLVLLGLFGCWGLSCLQRRCLHYWYWWH